MCTGNPCLHRSSFLCTLGAAVTTGGARVYHVNLVHIAVSGHYTNRLPPGEAVVPGADYRVQLGPHNYIYYSLRVSETQRMEKEYPQVQPKTTLSWVLTPWLLGTWGKCVKQKLIFLVVSLFPSLSLKKSGCIFRVNCTYFLFSLYKVTFIHFHNSTITIHQEKVIRAIDLFIVLHNNCLFI